MARYCLMDSIGCGVLAAGRRDCAGLLGPVVPGAFLPGGSRVPGTVHELDPVQAAFCIGTANRWLDFNDAWAGAEWGHPSDNIGGILAVADYLDRGADSIGRAPVTVGDVLHAMIKAYEIQGVIALEHSFNRLGFDHVLLIRVATAAVAARMLGGSRAQVINAVSNAWLDGLTLRTYRAITGTRKNWAAGDATSRGVRLALMSIDGEMGYPTALSEPHWGFQDVLYRGRQLDLQREFGDFVITNILFKVPYPAEGHALTACEAAVSLHPEVSARSDEVERIVIETQESAMRIINKTGHLYNAADRDHCMQYMVAVCLLNGDLRYEDYEDDAASDPRIDKLRDKMEMVENTRFTEEYDDIDKRTLSNAIQVFFRGGGKTDRIVVEHPAGHPHRRNQGIPMVAEKFRRNVSDRLPAASRSELIELFSDYGRLAGTRVAVLMDKLVV